MPYTSFQQELQEAFEYKEGQLCWKHSPRYGIPAGTPSGTIDSTGYTGIHLHGKRITLHRAVWEWHNGPIPAGMEIDHINHNRADNRIENLRPASRRQNACNTQKAKGTSKYLGVSAHRSRWRARCRTESGILDLKTFANEEDAATAYNFAVAAHHGEFAVYNTVPQPWLENV